MRCVTFKAGFLSEGIESPGNRIVIGDRGKDCWFELIFLSRNPAPEMCDGKVIKGHLHYHDTRNGGRWFLNASRGNDTRILAHINTRWSGNQGGKNNGRWETLAGKPITRLVGHGSGRNHSWDDGLVVFSSGDAIRVFPEGGSGLFSFAVWHDGEKIKCCPWSQHQAQYTEAVHRPAVENSSKPRQLAESVQGQISYWEKARRKMLPLKMAEGV